MGFNKVVLGDICNITKLAGFEFSKYIKYDDNGEIIAIRALNIKNGTLDLENIKRIGEDVSKSLPRSKLYKDEIVLTYTGANYGEVALINMDNKFHLAPNVAKLTVNELYADPYFVYSFMRSNHFRRMIKNYGGGSTQPTIPMKTIRQLPISLPSINKQKAISKILMQIDRKIELNNQINETLEEIAQALFKRWFVDFEFPNEEGKPYKSSGGEMIESELGVIPEKWQPGKLGDLIYVQNGYAFKSKDLSEEGEVGIIKIKNISDNTVDIINKQYICEDLVSNIHPKFKVYGTNLLIAMTGAEVGKIGLVPLNKQELYLNQRVGCIKEVIQGGEIYAYNYLLRAEAQEMIRAKAIGSAQPNISTSGIEELKIITPSKDILKAFEIIGGNLLYNMCRLREENNLLIQLRDTLLPKLMSGEIRVNDLES